MNLLNPLLLQAFIAVYRVCRADPGLLRRAPCDKDGMPLLVYPSSAVLPEISQYLFSAAVMAGVIYASWDRATSSAEHGPTQEKGTSDDTLRASVQATRNAVSAS